MAASARKITPTWPPRGRLMRTVGLVVAMLFAAAGGCAMLGVPEAWCELSAAGIWSVGIIGLTLLWVSTLG